MKSYPQRKTKREKKLIYHIEEVLLSIISPEVAQRRISLGYNDSNKLSKAYIDMMK